MKLHENKELFNQAVRYTADELGIKEIYVEKDYWVTYVLFKIFNSDIGKDTIFKGGTSLSKCYKLIDRMSEDIDLVVLRREGESDNKLKKIGNTFNVDLPEIEVESVTNKKGMIRKTAHYYNKEFQGDYGQVRDLIILESTWLGYYEPYTIGTVNSLISDMMLENGQEDIARDYCLLPFEVQVLDPVRTICEKIMSLVRFSYEVEPITALQNKIRHTYDLHQLLIQKKFREFIESSNFDEMLLRVAQDDIQSFKNNNEWLYNHPKNALIFSQLNEVWKQLLPIYNGDFKALLYGSQPDGNAIFETLKLISVRLQALDWDIK